MFPEWNILIAKKAPLWNCKKGEEEIDGEKCDNKEPNIEATILPEKKTAPKQVSIELSDIKPNVKAERGWFLLMLRLSWRYKKKWCAVLLYIILSLYSSDNIFCVKFKCFLTILFVMWNDHNNDWNIYLSEWTDDDNQNHYWSVILMLN